MASDPTVDAEILAQLQAGTVRQAVETAIRGHGRDLFRFILSQVKDEELANEAFGRLCETLCSDIAGFRGESSFLTWARKVAAHIVLRVKEEQRHRRQREPLGLLDPTTEGAPRERLRISTDERSATHPYQKTAIRKRVAALQARLPQEDQRLITLYLGEGRSWREIAETLAAEQGAAGAEAELERRATAVRKRFSRLIDTLAQSFAADGQERLSDVMSELGEEDRKLIELTLLQRRPWPEVVALMSCDRSSRSPDELRRRFQELVVQIASACANEGLLPAEVETAGLVASDDPRRSGPMRSLRSKQRRVLKATR